MKKRIIVSVMIACLLLALGVCIYHWRESRKYSWTVPEQGKYETTLRVVADIDYEPISFVDDNGNAAGHDVELVYAIGERLGVNIELEMMEWTDALEAFQKGEFDLMVSMAYIPERAEWLEHSTPIMNEAYMVFGRDMKNFSVAKLFGARIAMMAGDSVKDAIVRYYELEGTIYYLPTYIPCFEMLAAGECDYVIAPKTVGLGMLRELGIKDVEMSESAVYNNIYCMAAQKGNTALIDEVDRVLRELSADGTLNRLYNYWMLEYIGANKLDSLVKEEPEVFALVVLGVIFLFSVVVFYYETKRTHQLIEQMEKEQAAAQMNLRLDAALRQERQQYRGALLYDCIYAYNIDLEDGMIREMQKGELMNGRPVEFPIHNDTAVDQRVELIAPVMVYGTLEEQRVAHYLSEYEKGKRLLEFEYYAPEQDIYVRKNVFLSQNEENGHVLACVVAKDVTELRKEEHENKCALEQLTEAAERIAKGDLEVEINCYAGGAIAILADSLQKTVTELKKRIDYINDLAYIDMLTGVSNSTAYRKVLEELDDTLKQRPDMSFGLAMFDLNGLKKTNDTLGHRMGDLFIKKAVEHIRAGFPDCPIYRVGGDEFVALVFPPELDRLELMVEHMEKSLAEYNRTQTEFPDGVSVAVGCAKYDAAVDNEYKDVFQRADARMYSDKSRHKAGEVK